ncbi:cytochrome c oxidase accessory protein CcoG [Panacibacter sp. DH6]|uniref:Cytochrome c oxidase accessory protein CcoG n=1 Tax=Panacibacter microcysteis TaxID=2793269 RepID=A0A931GZA7_9BACT|nr:cytochrome c oxidase accessory protein CcoG [Panacibacter microcysteis]MBG9378121.1 cytochrome c oxidase accessory protein CcoG [Panacibacter microcysteis]
MEKVALKKVKEEESFRDHLATVDKKGKRNWIYAYQPKGRLYNIRTVLSIFYFLLFFGLPFVHLNGRPLFMFNIPQAKFILFGKVFWPQDFFILGLGMVTFIFFIILFTASFGRLFCGWACPQTNFMEMMFRKIEYLIEGDAAHQKILAKEPWHSKKVVKKLLKHVVFYLLSFIIANFFLAYIIGIKDLEKIITEPVSQHVGGLTAIMIFSGVFYGVYAFFREQACTVVCPYGRLQGVLLDKNSMIVAYDYKRGEPRGVDKKNSEVQHGDCIDCFQCVKVCPTGIDIRNGVQLECVGCTACIDACNNIMEKLGKPHGLIRYASENSIANGEPLKYTPRMKMYTALCGLVVIILSAILFTRKDIDTTVMRTPGILYQERGTDSISNLYNIKLANKTLDELHVTVKLEDAQGSVQLVGKPYVNVAGEGQGSGSFFVVLPAKNITARKTAVKLGLYQGDKKITAITTSFLGPVGD